MVKVALLIGVSEFADTALPPIPAALRDINAVQAVLNNAEMGGFDDVRLLENPDRAQMEEAIDALFRDRQKDDLVLLYFSGHGIKDDTGKFSLATRIMQKDRLRTTAVAASFVHEVMTSSRSRRQVVILDCCFSGAFATGMMAKDDASVDVKTQLGGEGRAVLTASSAVEYAFAQADEDLSIYTRFLVEGIRTGAADTDTDGHITVDELHHYAQRKVQEAAPAMKPEIYAVKEGYTIQLAKAPLGDPTLEYRKDVEKCVRNGQISVVGRRILQRRRDELKLTEAAASTIEASVLKPFQEYERNREEFAQALQEALEADGDQLSLETCDELTRYQQILKLRDEDITPILKEFNLDLAAPAQTSKAPIAPPPTLDTPPPIPTDDNLRSDKGVDYNKLRDLLKAQQWRDADYETYLVMLQVVGRKDGDWIRANEIQLFSCTDLRTIDQLWVKYSNGRFGLNVQKQIYLDCGGKPDNSYDEKNWEKFGDRVGWRVNGTWLSYSSITFGLSTPQGCFPLMVGFGVGVSNGVMDYLLAKLGGEIGGVVMLNCFSSLTYRLSKCSVARVETGSDTISKFEPESSVKPAPTIQTTTPNTPPPTPSSDNLRSDKGIDYTKLRDLLKAQQWKDADHETYLVMLQVVRRKNGDWLRIHDIKSFPCTDLRTIDQLWVKYSNGYFGFSVQKQIYLDCGGNPNGSYDETAWKKFGDRVGWRVDNTWISSITFNTTLSRGHLPSNLFLVYRRSLLARPLGGMFVRVYTCQI